MTRKIISCVVLWALCFIVVLQCGDLSDRYQPGSLADRLLGAVMGFALFCVVAGSAGASCLFHFLADGQEEPAAQYPVEVTVSWSPNPKEFEMRNPGIRISGPQFHAAANFVAEHAAELVEKRLPHGKVADWLHENLGFLVAEASIMAILASARVVYEPRGQKKKTHRSNHVHALQLELAEMRQRLAQLNKTPAPVPPTVVAPKPALPPTPVMAVVASPTPPPAPLPTPTSNQPDSKEMAAVKGQLFTLGCRFNKEVEKTELQQKAIVALQHRVDTEIQHNRTLGNHVGGLTNRIDDLQRISAEKNKQLHEMQVMVDKIGLQYQRAMGVAEVQAQISRTLIQALYDLVVEFGGKPSTALEKAYRDQVEPWLPPTSISPDLDIPCVQPPVSNGALKVLAGGLTPVTK